MRAWLRRISDVCSPQVRERGACEIAITEGTRTRYKSIADQLGYGDGHIDERLPPSPA